MECENRSFHDTLILIVMAFPTLDLKIDRERRDVPALGNLIFNVRLERLQIGMPPIVRCHGLLVNALGQPPSQEVLLVWNKGLRGTYINIIFKSRL